MIDKILNTAMLGIPACLSTWTTIVWWSRFGVHEVYPYLGTLIAIVLWWCVYLTITKKED